MIEKYTTTSIASLKTGLLQFAPLIPALIPVMINLWVTTIDQNWVKNQMWKKEYDFIIIGGGSAGSIIANRLAHEPDYRVLLLEAGGNENFISEIPALSQTIQQTSLDWQYITEPQENACLGLQNRQSRWPRGRVIGGSSVMNDMLYFNGNPNDFDKWERLGAKGWSWKDVRQHFPIQESDHLNHRRTDEDIQNDLEEKIQNSLTVPTSLRPLTRAFIHSGHKLNYPSVKLNTRSKIGFSVPQFTIDKGRRDSVAKVYLDPVRKNKNLDIVNYAFVKKIIIENNTATGVEFDRFGQTYRVSGKREIILSAGTINSPQILMLSGIGPHKHLRSLKIPVIKDLPVGHNLQDHYGTSLSFTINKNTAINFKRDLNFMELFKYFLYSEGLLSKSQIDSIAFINTDNSSDVPDVQLLLQPFSFASDNGVVMKKVHGISDNLWKYYKQYANEETVTIVSQLLHPKSRGNIQLKSSDPYDYPIIDPKYFSNPEDMKTIIKALKITQKISESAPFKALNVKIFRKPEECEKFMQKSDRFLECISRLITLTGYSPVGTCRMGSPSSPTSVVDPELRVIGIENLRVADASVMPTLISANPYATSVMIGERMAYFIINKDMEFEMKVWSHTNEIITNVIMFSMDIFGKITAWNDGDANWDALYSIDLNALF